MRQSKTDSRYLHATMAEIEACEEMLSKYNTVKSAAENELMPLPFNSGGRSNGLVTDSNDKGVGLYKFEDGRVRVTIWHNKKFIKVD